MRTRRSLRWILMVILLGAWGARAGENRTVLPGAALTAGVAGTHWRSSLQVLNPGGTSLEVRVRFLRFSSSESAEASFTVEGGHLLVLDDVVARLGATGAGTLEVSADGPILAGMRTYNRGGAGSFGQFVSPVPFLVQSQAQGYGAVCLPGVIDDGAFRSNLGVFNPEASGVSWNLDGTAMSLDGRRGWQHRVTDLVTIDAKGDSLLLGGDPVAAYLSVIDNTSGDPTFIPPQDPAISGSLVGVAHQNGANGTRWRSDLFVHAGQATTLIVELRKWGTPAGPSAKLELAAGETRVIRDVVGSLLGEEGGGVLSYSATHPVAVAARTYTEGPGGSSGQGILPAGIMEEGYFLFLRDDEDFRSNLALFNPTDGQSTYDLEAFSEDGVSLGTDTVAVPAGSAVQLNRVIRRFGLQELSAGYLRVSGGLFGGYLSFVDNASGDGSTVLPQGLVPEARIAGASVFGRILSAYGQASSAAITVFDAGDWSVVARPRPDHEGRFHANLPGPGQYWIVAGTPDGMAGARRLEMDTSPRKVEIYLRPAPGEEAPMPPASTKSIETVSEQIGTGTVSVLVLDACDDKGIAHADVRLINITTGLIVAADETRADGRVTFNDVPVNDDDTRGGTLSSYMVIAGGWALNDYEICRYLTVLLGVGDIKELEMRMMPREDSGGCYGRIQGHITDHCAGGPVAGTEVQVAHGLSGDGCDDVMDDLESTFADADGNYTLEKVVPGSVELLVGKPTVREAFGDCLACYWVQHRDLEVVKGETSTADFDLVRKGIIFLGQVKDRPNGDPVSFARVDLFNRNPMASKHGPLFTQEDGLFIFNTDTPPTWAAVTAGTLRVRLTDPKDDSCTSDTSFEICDWDYDEELILGCAEDWSGQYTTTITYSEDMGGALLTKDGVAHGDISFSVDAQGNVTGTAQDTQEITLTTPGCTTTYTGSGTFAITGQTITGGYRLFFDDEDSFVYQVKTVCNGAPPSTETQTGAAELQYAPMIEVMKDGEGRHIHFEDTHTAEHVGTYTIVLDAAKE